MAGPTGHEAAVGGSKPAGEQDAEVAAEPVMAEGNGKGKKRLPDEEVQWILSRERREFAPDASDVRPGSDEILRQGVEAYHVLSNSFAEYQDEIRAEYEAKGYVEVDDDFFERREEQQQSIREEFADLFDGIDLSGITFSDRYYNFDDDDDDEDRGKSSVEEEDEQEGAEVHPGCKST